MNDTGKNTDFEGPGTWIVIETKPRCESAAITNIRRQGFESFCPMMWHNKRAARKVERVQRPMFPSYIFVQLNKKAPHWRPLMSTIGVRSVVQVCGNPGILPSGFVEDLKQSCIDDQLAAVEGRKQPEFKIGDKVELLGGPFRKMIAEVLDNPNRNHIWLLLDLMGRKVKTRQYLDTVIAN